MPVESDPSFASFSRRRQTLFEHLDRLRASVDNWFASNSQAPSLADLALLEGLLAEKQGVLEQLSAAEGEMMNYLVQKRTNK